MQQDIRDGVMVLRPVGRLDRAGARELEDSVRAAINNGLRHVVLDFSRLTHIASAGLRATLHASKALTSAHGRLAIAAAGPAVLEVLRASGVGDVCENAASPDEAIERLRQG